MCDDEQRFTNKKPQLLKNCVNKILKNYFKNNQNLNITLLCKNRVIWMINGDVQKFRDRDKKQTELFDKTIYDVE